MQIPYLDLTLQYKAIQPALEERVLKVMRSAQYILGPEVKECEELLSKFVGVKHTQAVASGTDALMIALMALDVGPGDEVITTPFSFFATAEVILLVGAKPVFVDIDPVTFNIDVKQIEKHITAKTKVIMPVSLYGQMPDMNEIMAIANKHKIHVVEDAAQSFGAQYNGQRSCSVAHISATSFFPAKPLGCAGDGGAVFTNDSDLNKKMDQIKVHGQSARYHHERVGINGRLDTVQCAVVIEKLKRFPWEISMRQKIANRYNSEIKSKGIITLPQVMKDRESVWAQYTVVIPEREKFIKLLQEKGVPTSIHYPSGMHEQPAIKKLYSYPAMPVTERLGKQVVSLPLYADMPEAHVDYVIKCVNEVLG